MDQYLIQDTTLTGIADAIRSKTGTADAIMVSDMAGKIDGIVVKADPVLQEKTVTPADNIIVVTPDEGYDGLSKVTVEAMDGVVTPDSFHTITFCDYDGSVLYQRYVVDGDDCPDPVKQGRIDTPTKTVDGESLSWTGWSTTINGPKASAALLNITESKTLYAYFGLVGTLDDVSWADISKASLGGTASTKFKVGDTKAITLTNSDGTFEEVLVAIAGFNLHRSTGGTKNGITFIQKGHRAVNGSFSNGAAAIDAAVYELLDEDLKAVIRQSMITSGKSYSTTVGTVTNNQYVFVPEMTNLTTSLTNESGGSTVTVKDHYGDYVNANQYTNPYDAGLFPLFSGMTNAEVGQFLGITAANVSVGTRTRYYFKSSGAGMAVVGRIGYSALYSLYRYANTSEAAHFQFCFRV